MDISANLFANAKTSADQTLKPSFVDLWDTTNPPAKHSDFDTHSHPEARLKLIENPGLST